MEVSGNIVALVGYSILVGPILEAAGPRAFALVLGQRSIVDFRSDGEVRRTRLSRLLREGSEGSRWCELQWTNKFHSGMTR
jgi:hypothetical protein